jgi:hypothetical protein
LSLSRTLAGVNSPKVNKDAKGNLRELSNKQFRSIWRKTPDGMAAREKLITNNIADIETVSYPCSYVFRAPVKERNP